MEHAEHQVAPESAPAAPVAVAAAPAPLLAPSGLDAAGVLALQRGAGNAAVSRMLDPAQADGDPNAEAGEGEGEEVQFPSGMVFHEEPEEFVAFANGPRLEGKTTAHWDSIGHFDPDPPKASRDKKGMRVQGNFVVDYTSNPTVKLPDVPDSLNDCQKKNAEKFIRDVLEPHEQLHVKTFKQFFDGTTTTPFDIHATGADDVKAQVDKGYVVELAARKKTAQAESDKLDANGANVFTWDMDAGCDTKP